VSAKQLPSWVQWRQRAFPDANGRDQVCGQRTVTCSKVDDQLARTDVGVGDDARGPTIR
jgi:hypothetical protein